jgi:hypothetical protein
MPETRLIRWWYENIRGQALAHGAVFEQTSGNARPERIARRAQTRAQWKYQHPQ